MAFLRGHPGRKAALVAIVALVVLAEVAKRM